MQKIKNTIKRIAAISAGALMMGVTIAGAAAYTLADYPAPYLSAGSWTGLVVIGADSAGADSAGAIDIAMTLAQGVSGGGSTSSISGGASATVELGRAIFGAAVNQIDNPIKDDDVAGLQDTTISFDDSGGSDDYDIEDWFNMSSTSPNVDISSIGDPDYADVPVVEITKNSVVYFYDFDDTINMSTISTTYPLDLTFLGREISVTAVGNGQITATVGDSYYLGVGESVTVEGKTVKLLDVNSNGHVMVDVDGVQASVSTTKTVNGIQVHIKDYWSSDTKAERSATLVIGEVAVKTYKNDDPYVGMDKNDPDWRWYVNNWNTGYKYASNTTVNRFGITFDQSWNSDTEPVLQPGDEFVFPGGFYKIVAGDLSNTDRTQYTIEFDTDLDDLTGNYHTSGFTISTADDEAFTTSTGAFETRSLALTTNGTLNTTILWYWNSDENNWTLDGMKLDGVEVSEQFATINDGKVKFNLTIDSGSVNVSTKLYITEDLEAGTDCYTIINLSKVAATNFYEGLGTSNSANDAGDLFYHDGTTNTALGTRDEDTLTKYGIIIADPDTTLDEDKVELMIPGDQTLWTISVIGPGTSITTSTASGSLSSVPVVKLDTEVTDKTAYNMIIVGGAAINRLAAEVAGITYPTYGAANTDTFGISSGKGTIKLYSSAFGGTKTALLVAGWDAVDTRNAAAVLKDYSSYSSSLIGDQVIVTAGPTVTEYVAPTVTTGTTNNSSV